MSAPDIHFYARTPESVIQYRVNQRRNNYELVVVNEFKNEKCSKMVKSPNGLEIAMIYRSHVIIHCDNSTKFRKYEQGGVSEVLFSPRNKYIVLLSKYINPETPNLFIYRNLDVPELVHQFVDRPPLGKERRWPSMYWSENEEIFSYCVNAQIHFYNKNLKKLETCVFKKGVVLEYKLSPNGRYVAVSYYNQGTKKKMCEIFDTKSFKKPLGTAVMNDSDRDEIIWNQSNSTILILCKTYMDKTHMSYYGNNELFLLRRGWTTPKKLYNNIRDVQWNTQGSKFCVTFANPPKADLYDQSGKLLYQFDESMRDVVRFSPNGRVVALVGGSKLAGLIEFHDLRTKKMIGKCEADYPSLFVWQPDSQVFLNATVSPTLQVDNKIQVWDYTGKKLLEKAFETLYQVEFPYIDHRLFPEEKKLRKKDPKQKDPVKSETYVPPHLRSHGISLDMIERRDTNTRGYLTQEDMAKPKRNKAGSGFGKYTKTEIEEFQKWGNYMKEDDNTNRERNRLKKELLARKREIEKKRNQRKNNHQQGKKGGNKNNNNQPQKKLSKSQKRKLKKKKKKKEEARKKKKEEGGD